jgi:hypothetical protein
MIGTCQDDRSKGTVVYRKVKVKLKRWAVAYLFVFGTFQETIGSIGQKGTVRAREEWQRNSRVGTDDGWKVVCSILPSALDS